MNLDPIQITSLVIVGLFAIGLHEYAHCKFADMAGDPTPRMMGRVTLNLTKHFEPVGTIMMLLSTVAGVGIGWGRPAPIDPSKMRNPRWDTFAAVAAGPITNLLQAVVWAVTARVMMQTHQTSLDQILPIHPDQPLDLVGCILFNGIFLNLSLAFFNLFPIPPLDGHWLVGLLLPEKQRDLWFYYCRRYGWNILVGLIIIGSVSPNLSLFRLAGPIVIKLGFMLLGVKIDQ